MKQRGKRISLNQGELLTESQPGAAYRVTGPYQHPLARNSFLSSKSLLLEKSRNSSEKVYNSKIDKVIILLVQVTRQKLIGRSLCKSDEIQYNPLQGASSFNVFGTTKGRLVDNKF